MDKKEVLRYLRTNSKTEDEAILSLVDEAIEKVENKVHPKTLYRIFDCNICADEVEVKGFTFKSKRLADNLSGCKRLVLFGATLGIECDRMINLSLHENLSEGMALQAAAAQKIEEVCNSLEEEIKNEHGFSLRQRFSPGYFDLDITEQKKVFELLELTKRIGITLTQSCEMLPSKSVTAFIGIEDS